MTKLTDTQLLILSSAAQRDDLAVELPPTIAGSAAKKAIGQLRKRDYLDEVAVAGSMPVWREADSTVFALVITQAGLDAIGIVPEERRPEHGTAVPRANSRKRGASKNPKKQPAGNSAAHELSKAPREGSKLEGILALLKEPGGASIAQMIEATGWLPHTTRAALTGLRKRGYSIERVPGSDGKTSYSLASMPAAGEARSGGSEQA